MAVERSSDPFLQIKRPKPTKLLEEYIVEMMDINGIEPAKGPVFSTIPFPVLKKGSGKKRKVLDSSIINKPGTTNKAQNDISSKCP